MTLSPLLRHTLLFFSADLRVTRAGRFELVIETEDPMASDFVLAAASLDDLEELLAARMVSDAYGFKHGVEALASRLEMVSRGEEEAARQRLGWRP